MSYYSFYFMNLKGKTTYYCDCCFVYSMCVCVFPHPFHLVAHSDLQQRGEIGEPGAEAVP